MQRGSHGVAAASQGNMRHFVEPLFHLALQQCAIKGFAQLAAMPALARLDVSPAELRANSRCLCRAEALIVLAASVAIESCSAPGVPIHLQQQQQQQQQCS